MFLVLVLSLLTADFGFRYAIADAGICHSTVTPPEPSSKCCGIDAASISKLIGSQAEPDGFPWVVLIEHSRNDTITTPCSGVLISGQYVLTTAHCVDITSNRIHDLTPKNIRLGEYQLSNNGPDCIDLYGISDCTDGHIVIPIEKITLHPEYDRRVRWNDIAVIKMARTAPYNDFIRPICLPEQDVTANPPANLHLTEAGWGTLQDSTQITDFKTFLRMKYKSPEECQNLYNAPNRKAELSSKQLCAGDGKTEGFCRGNSGGPLMNEKDDYSYEVVGITSFGLVGCGSGVPTVYAKVYEYKDWIKSVTI